MRRLVPVAATVLLAVQGLLSLAECWHASMRRMSEPFGRRFLASTEDRIAAVLGADNATYRELADGAGLPAGAVLACHDSAALVAGLGTVEEARRLPPERFEQLNQRNGLLVQLKMLLFPRLLALALPDPVGAVEGEVRAGRAAALCLLPGDPDPGERNGWRCRHKSPHVQVWTFQTE